MSDAIASSAIQLESQWRPYPAYKDSGVEWLGEIPKHWEIRRLKYVARLLYGDSLPTDSREDGGVPVLGSNGIVGIHNIANTNAPLIIVGRKGSYGKITFSERPCFAIDTTYFIDRRSTNEDIRWLYYALMVLRLDDFSEDSAVPGLSREYVYAKTHIVPPVSEQRAIADFLDHETAKIDTLIAKKERLIELLTEKRTALISHAVTKGLDPTVPMKDSGVEWLGKIPAHWMPKKIKHLFRQTKRQNYAELTVLSVYREYGVIEKDSRDDNHNRTPENLYTYQLVNVGDLVINKMKAWQGSLGISDYHGITSPDYVVYAPKHNEDNRFLHYLLRARSMADVYRSISNGIRPSQWRLKPENFEKLVVFLPLLNEQAQICKFIDSEYRKIDHLIEHTQKLIGCLGEYRTAIISAAVTGKIDVRSEVT